MTRRWGLVGGLLLLTASGYPPVEADFTASSPIPGGVVMIELGPVRMPRPEARFGGEPVLVTEQRDYWIALVGIGLDTVPGDYIVTVLQDGQRPHSRVFTVRPYTYPIASDGDAPARPVERESVPRGDLVAAWRDTLDAAMPLVSPVAGRIAAQFGTRRLHDDTLEEPLPYLEFAVDDGTTIRAPGAGVVTLVPATDKTAGAVLVDHGMGLQSVIAPLTTPAVTTGQTVNGGDPLGRWHSDAAGHIGSIRWSLSMNGVFVDPLGLNGQNSHSGH